MNSTEAVIDPAADTIRPAVEIICGAFFLSPFFITYLLAKERAVWYSVLSKE